MTEARALQALDPAEFLQCLDVLRADAIDEDLVQFGRIARGRHRKGEHVPERKAEIIHQYLAPCLGLPGGGIEGGEQLVEVAGARGEVDFAPERLHQPVELFSMDLDETAREGGEILRVLFGRLGFEQIAYEAVRFDAIEPSLLAAPQ